MATLKDLEFALVNADRAGDADAARKLAALISRERQNPASQIPDTQIQGAPEPEPGIGAQAIGMGEAGLTAATGLTGGAIGMIGGTLKGLAEQLLSGQFGTQDAMRAVERSASQGAQALTYAPRTEAGQEAAQTMGEGMQNLIPLAGMAPQIGALAAGARGVAPVAGVVAQRAVAPAQAAVKSVVKSVGEAVRPGGAKPASGTMGSMGAAGVDMATVREMRARDLPVPIKMTEGQKTRSFEQQRFEREAAKNPEIGGPIRDRFAEQNKQLQQNLDNFVDATGAESTDLRSIGISVDTALRRRAARDKVEIRSLYKEAEKSGELAAQVDLAPLAEYLNANRSGRSSAPILGTIADELAVQEIGNGSIADGTMQAGAATLQQAENVRKAINRFAKQNDANDLRIGSEMKALIDAQTEGVGGAKYQQARAARARFAQNYENIGLVKNLLNQKRGTADRGVAFEDVLNRTIIEPSTSLDTVRQVRRLLQTEGAQGQQAWRELQGGTLRHIRDQAIKNVARDEGGNAIVSAAQLDRAITQLDKTGKLDFVFGKNGAEQLRTINDIAKDLLVAPPGAVNTSNTASVILAAMDMAISGTAGVPAPILSSLRILGNSVKDAKTRARVRQALGIEKE